VCYVFTAGYEGTTINEFVNLLKQNKIERVIDVREIPLSRKKGFSKASFSENLTASGIEYMHIRGLGSPKPIRDDLHKSKDYEAFFFEYKNYISRNFSYIQEAWEYALDKRACLVCFEKDYHQCHRSVVAELIYKRMPLVDGVVNI
jgi:uncharacterized protein (DUF488 family)